LRDVVFVLFFDLEVSILTNFFQMLMESNFSESSTKSIRDIQIYKHEFTINIEVRNQSQFGFFIHLLVKFHFHNEI